MNSTVISVKMDRRLKEEAQELAKDMGFPLSTLINAFLKQLIRNKTVYFTLQTIPFMTKALEGELREIEKDLRKEKNLSPSFNKMEDAISYLKKK